MPLPLNTFKLPSHRIAWILAGISLLHGQPAFTAEEKEEAQSPARTAFPTLDILPEGSILQRVRLPRYDKDYNPESLLKADRLTVLDQHRIEGHHVTIELYDKDGTVRAHTEMAQAIYNQQNSTLHASETITLRGDLEKQHYRANGTGLIFHWNQKRGFLLGPASTEFLSKPVDTSSAMQLKPHPRLLTSSLAITAAITNLTQVSVATPPTPLTEAQLGELDQLAKPTSSVIEHKQQEAARSLEEERKLMQTADDTMAPFLESIGQGALLVSTAAPTKATSTPQVNVKDTTPNTGNKNSTKKEAPPQLLEVKCDGGLYFDTDTGVLAYLKNIRLKEPRFELTCSDELKVFLEKKQVEAKTAKPGKSNKKSKIETPRNETPKTAPPTNTPETKQPKSPNKQTKTDKTKEEAKKGDENSLAASFGDLKKIVATGSVRIIRKDEKGQTYIATSETASYDAKTGEMILRGKKPRIQIGKHQYVQSEEDNKYIKIEKNGKFLLEGRATTVIDTSQAKLSSDKDKKAAPKKTAQP
ncbi:hypothetical protein HW115_07325 [Verrucomicrobiaceae bacterium N1E253]|uniref:Organic solvent tolerance-like N-terminal domain-containing protein n=1 Tax=Oceaniferula marina TaxID=2748318 RepID=A0A851GJZ7_9BACT|nr:hypothetical protein [Oceaniferula marina]NWK55417.1 hypothetical protein [Oceaniferula marina]